MITITYILVQWWGLDSLKSIIYCCSALYLAGMNPIFCCLRNYFKIFKPYPVNSTNWTPVELIIEVITNGVFWFYLIMWYGCVIFINI
jgi:hypothetical protein